MSSQLQIMHGFLGGSERLYIPELPNPHPRISQTRLLPGFERWTHIAEQRLTVSYLSLYQVSREERPLSLPGYQFFVSEYW